MLKTVVYVFVCVCVCVSTHPRAKHTQTLLKVHMKI